MEKTKRLLALILASAFLLGSCGPKDDSGEGNKPAQKGAYIEEILYEVKGDNKYVNASNFMAGNFTVKVAEQESKKSENIVSTDGKTWNTIEVMKKFYEENPGLFESASAFSPSGKYYALFYKEEEGGQRMGQGKPYFYVFEADGETYKEIDLLGILGLKDGELPMVNKILAPRDDRLLVHYNIAQPVIEDGSAASGGMMNPAGSEVQVIGGNPSVEEEISGAAEGAALGEVEESAPEVPQNFFPGPMDKPVAALINPETGEKVTDLETPEEAFYGGAWTANSSHIFSCLDMEGLTITAFSLEDGKEDSAKSMKAQTSGYTWNHSYFADENGDLYWINSDGINHLVSGGTVVETLFSSSGFLFSLDTMYADSLARDEEGRFVVLLGGTDGQKIVRYTYDENFDAGELITVKVYSIIKDSSINHAIIALKKSNPSILVEYEVAFPEMYSLTEISESDLEAELRLLNTEILTGEGPDVLIMDGLDIENFVEKGFLLSLDGLVDTSGIYKNVIKALNPGETFVVPSKMTVPIFLGAKEDIEDVNSLEEFLSAVEGKPKNNISGENMFEVDPLKLEDRAYFTSYESGGLFNSFFDSYSNMIIGKDGINEESLRNLFETLKKYSDYNGIENGENMGFGGVGMSSSMAMGVKITGSLTDSLMALNNGQSLSAMYDVDGFMYMLTLVEKAQKEIDTIKGVPGAEGNVFKPSSILAINKQSKNPDLAAEIINMLISYETQMAVEFALPVREDVLTAQMDMIDKYFAEVSTNLELGETAVPTPEEIAAFKAPITEYLNTVDTAANTNFKLRRVIFEAYSEYISGTITLDEAVNKIKEATKFYFAEK